MSEISQILKTDIYPIIDAADAGLLDSLNPSKSGEYYKVNCPKCSRREAFYRPGYASISCSRKKECGKGTSIFDVVQLARGLSNRDTLIEIFGVAGEDLPEDPNFKKESHPVKKAGEVYKSILKQFLLEDAKAMNYMLNTRGWSLEEIKKSELGYLPSFKKLREKIIEIGEGDKLKTLSEFDLLKEDKESKGSFEGRIIGFWPQPEMFSLWGRAINSENPKYKYQTDKTRDIPYLANKAQLNKEKSTSLVEGVLDAQRLRVNNFDAWGIGSNSPSNKQIEFIANRNARSFIHWIDNDIAGIKGGLRSILELNKFNTRIGICYSRTGKDADDLISEQGRAGVTVSNLIFQKDHEFLAAQIKDYIDTNGRIPSWINNLNQDLWFDLTNICREQKLEISNNISDALRSAALLLELGQEKSNVERIIKSKFKVALNFEQLNY